MRESLFFHLHVCVKVDPRRLHRLVTEPQSDYARVHAAAQKGHGGCVPQRMRRHGLPHERRAHPTRGHGMPDNESLQGVIGEVPAFATAPKLWTSPEDAPRAHEILTDLDESAKQGRTPNELYRRGVVIAGIIIWGTLFVLGWALFFLYD